MSEQLPSLTTNAVDWTAVAAKGGLGAIPVVGSLAAELVGSIIPNQRMDRIVHFLELLEVRVKDLEKSKLDGRKSDPQFVDIMEDAFFQASRAVSEDRLEHIANVVAKGLSADELNYAEAKQMLWLLGQLNDIEIVILRSRLALTNEDHAKDRDFRNKYQDILQSRVPVLGSDQDEHEEQGWRTYSRINRGTRIVGAWFDCCRVLSPRIVETRGKTNRHSIRCLSKSAGLKNHDRVTLLLEMT